MELKIPSRSFAVAAAAASEPFKCEPGFIFGGGNHVSTRARTCAAAAMIRVFPKAKRVSIAQGFNIKVEQAHLATMINQARRQQWWCEHYVNTIVEEIKRDLLDNPGPPHVKIDVHGNIEFVQDDDDDRPVLKELEPEVVATKYTPRRYRPARIIYVGAARPGNVTASLLGDPPPGRREQLAAMRSQHYMAGNESGRFRYRGKRVLEAAE